MPQIADAARKNDRREGDQNRKHDESGERQNDRQDGNQHDRKSDGETKSETKAENQDSNHRSEKRERSESRTDDDGGHQAESEGRSGRREAKRQDADSESSESSGTNTGGDNDDGSRAGGRRSREFEQQAADEPADDGSDSAIVLQTNPNIVLDDLPETSITDLVVEAGDDVIASVSASGGFAFARSGGVTAVTGPDGASIIQTGDTDAPAPTTPTDEEPSDDGGNNDMDFAS